MDVLRPDQPAEPGPRLSVLAVVTRETRRGSEVLLVRRANPPQPGQTVNIDVTWTVIQTPDANYSATLQLLDATGARIAGSDLLAGGGMPPTTEWQPGQQVTLTFPLVLDPALAPSDYRLLTAVYAYRPDFPRLRVELADGSVATEAIVEGFTVGR